MCVCPLSRRTTPGVVLVVTDGGALDAVLIFFLFIFLFFFFFFFFDASSSFSVSFLVGVVLAVMDIRDI